MHRSRSTLSPPQRFRALPMALAFTASCTLALVTLGASPTYAIDTEAPIAEGIVHHLTRPDAHERNALFFQGFRVLSTTDPTASRGLGVNENTVPEPVTADTRSFANKNTLSLLLFISGLLAALTGVGLLMSRRLR